MMEAIKENIVGLIKFIGLLCLMFIPVKKFRPITSCLEEPEGSVDKYQTILGQKSMILVPTETKFCPKCHLIVAQVRHTKEGIEIIQNGKVRLIVGSNVIISKDGNKVSGFPMTCPNGHIVRVE